jgi:hypothetical protein
MTAIKKEDLKDFMVIYEKEFWTKISKKEALDLAIPLLILTKSVLLPNLEKVWVK